MTEFGSGLARVSSREHKCCRKLEILEFLSEQFLFLGLCQKPCF